MCDLLEYHWLRDHIEEHGDYPLEWEDYAKDEAAHEAMHNCQNADRRNECLADFFANKGLEALYLFDLSPAQQAEIVRNNIWACLESAIVEQCASIVETRGWKE